MGRQLDAAREARQAKRDSAVLLAVGGGLEMALARSDAEFTGLNISFKGDSAMGVVKAFVGGCHQVAFVGADDIEGVLIKAYREANAEKLRWREDKFRGAGTIDEKGK